MAVSKRFGRGPADLERKKGLDLSIHLTIFKASDVLTKVRWRPAAPRSSAIPIHGVATRLWGRDGGKKLGCRHHRSRFHPIDHIRNYSRTIISNLFLIGLCVRIEFVLSLLMTAKSVVVRFIFSRL